MSAVLPGMHVWTTVPPGPAAALTPLSDGPATDVEAAVFTRRSVRAYLPRAVPKDAIERILRAAGTAPSGSNTQPWRVYVMQGAALRRLAGALQGVFLADEPRRPEYEHYSSPLPPQYLARRRECGFGLYGALGVARGDLAGRKAYRAANYAFFGAPVGMVFTIDRRLSLGSWLDYGMFLQTAMLTARGLGLHTCAEGSIAEYPDVVRSQLGLPDEELVLCGMALGYADPAAVLNRYQPRRCPLPEYVTFLET